MRPIGEIFRELGFNEKAPLETQKSFFRHLVQHAEMVRAQNSRIESGVSEAAQQTMTETSTQLSFDPKILGVVAK